jgi:hypothetical protein
LKGHQATKSKKTLTPAVSFLTFLWFICICIVCSFDCLLACLFVFCVSLFVFVFHWSCSRWFGTAKGIKKRDLFAPKKGPETKKKVAPFEIPNP